MKYNLPSNSLGQARISGVQINFYYGITICSNSKNAEELHDGATQYKPKMNTIEYLCFAILDNMSFIKDNIVPLDEGEEVYVIPHNVIRSNHQVVI